MIPYKVGDQVVCVDNKNKPGRLWAPGTQPTLGAIYTICDIRPSTHPLDHGEVVLFFDEIKNIRTGFVELGYMPWRFRPLQKKKTDISVFEAILKTAKDEVKA